MHFTLTARYKWGFQKYFSSEVSLALRGAGLTLCPLENSTSIATASANLTPYCHNHRDRSNISGMLHRAYGYTGAIADRAPVRNNLLINEIHSFFTQQTLCTHSLLLHTQMWLLSIVLLILTQYVKNSECLDF